MEQTYFNEYQWTREYLVKSYLRLRYVRQDTYTYYSEFDWLTGVVQHAKEVLHMHRSGEGHLVDQDGNVEYEDRE